MLMKKGVHLLNVVCNRNEYDKSERGVSGGRFIRWKSLPSMNSLQDMGFHGLLQSYIYIFNLYSFPRIPIGSWISF
jgi:hypothetical protein